MVFLNCAVEFQRQRWLEEDTENVNSHFANFGTQENAEAEG